MKELTVIIVFLFAAAAAKRPSCSEKEIISYYKHATYDFSVRLLDRVSQETDAHFIYSPISTWMQLMTLKEGSRGTTRREIWKVTRYNRIGCFQRKFRYILNRMQRDLRNLTMRNNIVAINKLLNVKESYKARVRGEADTTVLLLNFNEPEQATVVINKIVRAKTNGVIVDAIDTDEFIQRVVLMIEAGYFKSDWLIPFNPAYTNRELFYAENGIIKGEVDMMINTGYYFLTQLPQLNVSVLELPFHSRNRLSMLVFLPTEGSVRDVYYYLRYIKFDRIRRSLKSNGAVLTTVKLPRFKIRTNVENLPELVYDMGIKRIFYPDLADFKGISDYKMYVSSMSQISDVEVTEKGARINVVENMISDNANSTVFYANRPFAFLIVDWKTEVILFAGSYSEPSVF